MRPWTTAAPNTAARPEIRGEIGGGGSNIIDK